jgi:protein gp37
MSDLFHDDVSDQFLLSVLLTIWQAPQHTFLILTKRPDRMEKFIKNYYRLGIQSLYSNIPLSNLWLGVTAENQEQADKRIPILLQIPAAKRFVSVEPMLSTINISKYLRYDCDCGICNFCNGGKPLDMIDWVINGGESGPGARPVHPDWMRSLRDQCKAAGTPFLFKQFGEWYPINGTGRLHGEEDKAIKPYCWISLDGETSGSGCEPDSLMVRVGKHKAGRLLDGQLWDQYPESES